MEKYSGRCRCKKGENAETVVKSYVPK